MDELTHIQELIADVSEGCPGTIAALMSMTSQLGDLEMELVLLVLGLYKIRGNQPAVLYKDCCNGSVANFYKVIYGLAYLSIDLNIIKNAISDRRSLEEELQGWTID